LRVCPQGVDLVLGDGGISVEGEENFQEIKLQPLILCQFLTMFNILAKGKIKEEAHIHHFVENLLLLLLLLMMIDLTISFRSGGKFVCKIFDVFTPFTAGLIYILYRHFERICIIKPYTSRPANSER
jgi:cap1 methyltransferase